MSTQSALETENRKSDGPAGPSSSTQHANLARHGRSASVLVSLVSMVFASIVVATVAPVAASAASPTALIGGTPRGASNAAGVAAMDSTYGHAKVIRLFWSGAAGTSPTSNREVVGSMKSVTSSTAPWARTMWRWTYMHEIDSKIKKGQMTLAQWRKTMTSLVALKVPGLSVILTADAFVNSSKHPADYLIPGITHWGVDFDGISQSGGYHNYAKELASVQSFTKAHNLTWGVAEFGANRASNDPSGTARASWLKTWNAKFVAAGAEYVCLWENNSQAGSDFTTSAENSAVRQMLASSPSSPPPAGSLGAPHITMGTSTRTRASIHWAAVSGATSYHVHTTGGASYVNVTGRSIVVNRPGHVYAVAVATGKASGRSNTLAV